MRQLICRFHIVAGQFRQRFPTRLIEVSILVLLLAIAPAVASDRNAPLENRIARVENGLLPASVSGATPAPPWNIRDRMQYYQVPGVSIVVIHNFEVAWARGYGVLESGSSRLVNTETLFQAASLSKPVTAMGILSLVQGGTLGLDEEVNRRLTSWHIPDNPFTAVRQVTARHLLAHMAGTTSFGYFGYFAGQPLPTLLQVLDGRPPANSPPVRVNQVPGTAYRYSNGGFLVLQQLAMDLTRTPFAQWMQAAVLDKLEMGHSTFQQPLPTALEGNAASGHLADGSAIRGKWMIHPELAASGLWTTATDLANFVIEIQKSFAMRSNRVLSPELIREMLTPQAPNYGLGIEVQSDGALFYHTGANNGFRSILLGYPHLGEGAVVMTNSDAGAELRLEIVRSIAAEYGWPHLRIPGYPAGAPDLASSNAVVNAASSQPFVAPSSIVSIYGPDLADVGGVEFNGLPATILALSANQINAVLPSTLGPGLAILQVKRAGIASAGREVRIDRYAPGLFSLNLRGDGPGIIVHADTFRMVSDAEPARRVEYLSVLCTGFGTDGAEPTVTVGEIPARVLWSGPMPGFLGVTQVNIQVPEDAPRGTEVPVLLRLAGAVSNSVTVAID